MDVAILECYSLPTKNTICGAIAPPILAEVFASPYAVALQNNIFLIVITDTLCRYATIVLFLCLSTRFKDVFFIVL